MSNHLKGRTEVLDEKKEAPTLASTGASLLTKQDDLLSQTPFAIASPNGLSEEVREELLQAQQTDVGNSSRLAILLEERVKYVSDWGQYIVYDGMHWAKCDDIIMKGAAVRCAKALQEVAQNSGRESLVKHALKSQGFARLKAMLDLLPQEPGITITSGQLDREKYLLNVQNGTIDLKTGELRSHNKEDYITRVCPVDYDPDAKTPVFSTFIRETTCEDRELEAYLKRVLGYMATGDTSEQCLFFFFGNGQNGKSILMDLCGYVLKPYVVRADKTSLMNGLRNAGGASPDLLKLQHARIVVASELDQGQRFDEGQIKDMTGGETISCRGLYKGDYVEYVPNFKLLLSGNSKPQIVGTDDGVWRRFQIVPFLYKVPEDKRDRRLAEKLQVEASGFLNWVVQGCLEWQREGLNPPECVRKAVAEYRQASNHLEQWLAERCEEAEDGLEAYKELKVDCHLWAVKNGEQNATDKALGAFLTQKFEKVNSGGIKYRGVRLKQRDKASND